MSAPPPTFFGGFDTAHALSDDIFTCLPWISFSKRFRSNSMASSSNTVRWFVILFFSFPSASCLLYSTQHCTPTSRDLSICCQSGSGVFSFQRKFSVLMFSVQQFSYFSPSRHKFVTLSKCPC